MIQLRKYQQDAIDQMRALMRQGCRSILYQGATGSGKTALTAHMLHTAASRGLRSWFVVHRRELIQQSAKAFDQEGLKYGIISAGFGENRNEKVQIASVQTLTRRLTRYPDPQLIVFDEAHHTAAGSWQRIYQQYPRAYRIGITATPCRLDGKGLAEYFGQIVCGPSVSWLIEHGYLAKYRLYAPSTISTEGLHTRMGDFAQNELAALADRPTITGSALAHYQRLAHGKRAVIFAVSIQHSQHIVAQFQAAGIQAAHVDGETPKEVRDELIGKFKAGDIRVLSNVELFSEGFDVPAMEVAILLRPTMSLGLFLQQIGRALRPCEGKSEAIILDHAGNAFRHGLPDDDREWALEGNFQRGVQKNGGSSVRVCPSCFAAQSSGGSLYCKFCNFIFEVKPRKVEEKEGELEEVTHRIARQEQGMTQDFNSLIALGKQRGYKNPFFWARMVMQGREAKRRRAQARLIHAQK